MDQVLHVGFIATVFFTDLAQLKPPASFNDSFLTAYNSNFLILLLCAILLASYNGHYILLLYRKDYIQRDCRYLSFEKWYGMIERVVLVFLALSGGIMLWGIALVMMLRPLIYSLKKEQLEISTKFLSLIDISFSCIIGAACGLILNFLV